MNQGKTNEIRLLTIQTSISHNKYCADSIHRAEAEHLKWIQNAYIYNIS